MRDLAQFDLRGPFVASFADRSVIDAHRGRIERARQPARHPRRRRAGSTCSGGRCVTRRRARSSSAPDYGAADGVDTDAGGGPGRRLDRPDDRSEPDHVEALIALQAGRGAPRARPPWSGGGARCHDRGSTLGSRGLERWFSGVTASWLMGIIDAAPTIRGLPFETARMLLVRGQLERRANRKLAARDSLTEALGVFEELVRLRGARGMRSPGWASVIERRLS